MTENSVTFEPEGSRTFVVVKKGTERGTVERGFNGKWYFIPTLPVTNSAEFLTSVAEFIRTLPVTEKATGTTN